MTDDTRAPIDQALNARGKRPSKTPIDDSRRVVVPIDHNPDAVIGEGSSAQTAKRAMLSIWEAWNAVKAAAEDVEDTDLPALARVSQRAVERGLASADKASAAILTQMGAIEADITKTIQPPQSDQFAGEIRAHWQRELGAKGRSGGASKLGILMKAIQDDRRTASAVLSGPAYLSGLDNEQHALMRTVAVNAHCPERQADLDEAQRAVGKVQAAKDRVAETLAPKIRLWANPEPTKLHQLRSIADGR